MHIYMWQVPLFFIIFSVIPFIIKIFKSTFYEIWTNSHNCSTELFKDENKTRKNILTCITGFYWKYMFKQMKNNYATFKVICCCKSLSKVDDQHTGINWTNPCHQAPQGQWVAWKALLSILVENVNTIKVDDHAHIQQLQPDCWFKMYLFVNKLSNPTLHVLTKTHFTTIL